MSLLPKVPSAFKGPQATYVIELIRQLERELKRRPAVQQDGVMYIGHDVPYVYVDENGNQYKLLTTGQLVSEGGNILTAAQLASNGGSIVEAGDESWQIPTLQNGWINYEAGYITARYRKLSSGLVVLSGLVKSGATGVPIFNLPSGYRPTANLIFPAVTSPNAIGRVDVVPSGDVLGRSVDPGWVSLDGIRFYAEQ